MQYVNSGFWNDQLLVEVTRNNEVEKATYRIHHDGSMVNLPVCQDVSVNYGFCKHTFDDLNNVLECVDENGNKYYEGLLPKQDVVVVCNQKRIPILTFSFDEEHYLGNAWYDDETRYEDFALEDVRIHPDLILSLC